MPFRDLPAKEQGIDITRTFVLLKDSFPFKNGQKLRLLKDWNSLCPCFATADSTFSYEERFGQDGVRHIPWRCLDYADEPQNKYAYYPKGQAFPAGKTFKELNLDPDAEFVCVVEDDIWVKEGQLMRLLEDDKSDSPAFRNSDRNDIAEAVFGTGGVDSWRFCHLSEVAYAHDYPLNQSLTTNQAQTNEPIIKKFMNTLAKKFKELTRTEPEKSLISLGFTDEQDLLTEEGRNAFVQWLFSLDKSDFFEQVVKPIKEAQEKE